MASILPALDPGLSCSPSPLGIAHTYITSMIQSASTATLSQLCDRPADASYDISESASTVTLSFDTELVRIFVTLPSEDAAQGSAVCRDAFESIVSECVETEGVWGGIFESEGVRYGIEEGEDAREIVERLEWWVRGEEIDAGLASGVASGYPEASGIASGYPVPSGVASGYPGLPVASGYAVQPAVSGYPLPPVVSGYPVPPAVSGFPVQYPPLTPIMPTATFVAVPPPSWVPAPTGPVSGYPAPPPVATGVGSDGPGYTFMPIDSLKRGEGKVDEARPRVRWIQG